MKKIIVLLLVFIATQNLMAQKSQKYIVAWCSSKELRDVSLGCLTESPVIIDLEHPELSTKAYKLAMINEKGEKMIFSSHNVKPINDLVEKAKYFRATHIEIFDVIIGDKENTYLLEEKFLYPVRY